MNIIKHLFGFVLGESLGHWLYILHSSDTYVGVLEQMVKI